MPAGATPTLELPASLAASYSDLRDRIAALSDEQRAEFERSMDLDESERFTWQTLQSRAFAMDRIPMDIAQFLYRAIGESGSARNGGWPLRTDLPTKVLVTMAIGELAKGR